MPSVEMRRSTRVFVPKSKDGDLGRVLRSGRRLWVESPDCGFPLMNDNGKVKQQKVNGWHGLSNPVHGLPVQDPMDVDEVKPPLIEVSDQKGVCGVESRMFRNVYNRKRKRCNVRNLGGFIDESKKFGLHFVRRKKRKALGNVDGEFKECVNCLGLCVIVEDSSFFSRVLSLILCYVGEGRVGLAELWGFLVSSPVSRVFASSGVHFLWNRCPIKSKGLCRIVGERQKTAMFTIDFMAAPQCFQHISFALLIRSVRLSCLYMIDFPRKHENDGTDELLPYINDQNVSYMKDNVLDEFLLNINEKIESPPDIFQNDQNVSSKKDDVSDKFPRNVDEKIERSPGVVLALAAVCGKDVKPVNKISGAVKTSVRNVPLRIGVRTRSSSKRRRRSLRSRRARNPLHLVLQKLPLPPLSTDLVSSKKQKTISCVSPKNIVPSLPISSPRQEIRKFSRKNSDETQVQNANPLGLSVDIYSQSCFANILVVESDKCYRVEGAEVMLEASASNEWNLVVKKDGLTRYSFKVQREMRPGATNRYTHAFIWTLENGWKLEFPERNEWVVFKELYKVCGEKNIVPASPVKIIPIPEVCEVKNQLETSGAFKRPKAYIKTNGDELSRTLSRKTASYDMDSDDEEWLRTFNSELDDSNCVSDVSFELMIDAFEKASYCKPEDVNDEKAAASLCSDVGGKEVAEPVYKYWMNKRKQKRAPLLRVFQLNQPTRAPLISKPVLRKKRSLKRSAAQPIQRGHGKDSTVLQAEQEEQSALLRVQEAKASAEKSVELAILKRQRAQFLMENADLAMYRATVALRIADAAAEILDSQQAANHFLD